MHWRNTRQTLPDEGKPILARFECCFTEPIYWACVREDRYLIQKNSRGDVFAKKKLMTSVDETYWIYISEIEHLEGQYET